MRAHSEYEVLCECGAVLYVRVTEGTCLICKRKFRIIWPAEES